jgi:hypothetical protein
MRIALVTCSAHAAGRPGDRQLAELIGAEIRIWDDPQVDWRSYDRVVIRSTWDYSQRVEEFLRWCELVGAQRLRNPPEIVAFSADKRYLGALRVPTVPTTFLAPGYELPEFEREIVVKPHVSAGARNTGRFVPEAHQDASELARAIHGSGRLALVQPYLESVDSEGETAVVLFDGIVSHALHKRPVLRTPGIAPLADSAHAPAAVMLDPDLVRVGAASEAQLDLARAAVGELTERFGCPLYARVDMVSDDHGRPVVMELELIEPNLYLELVPEALTSFAAAICR